MYSSNLTEKDKFFVDFLKTKDFGYLEAYKNITYKELKSKKYIIENDSNFNLINSSIKNIVIIGIYFLIIIGLILVNEFIIKDLLVEDIIGLVIIIMTLVIAYKKGRHFVAWYADRKSRFRRTKLGEEKTTYIHALQNFIHDFGNLKEHDKEQIVIWEDFLIYAIVLEQNDKIVKDIAKFFDDKYSDDDFMSIFNFLNRFKV